MTKLRNLEYLKEIVLKKNEALQDPPFRYPPPIAHTLGFELTEIGEGTATLEMQTKTEAHANPMGTIHGGVLCDLADAAIGTAHVATLVEGESFTSVDLQINFFRPVWNEKIRASARPIH